MGFDHYHNLAVHAAHLHTTLVLIFTLSKQRKNNI